ncbi:hypothetical protein KUTeg_007685 [Tegillarca granosa]|uniref:Catalase core domain-containing protein n=1 Tax=Tegillarca granosa TaxID=220873 RepID=A0ABQ9FGY8_TEGGR|nr:hypothetical protein KUTeg_007685 [Tegillarca granosa]
MANRDKATEQLTEFKNSQTKPDVLTTGTGAPVGTKTATLTVGPRGPVLIQDFVFTDEMAHFNRERIPERVVHAKGGGAFGYFETTHDISKYCKAKPFEFVGKKTPLAVRFSTVGGESGSADTARDPRGFAVKFYTEDGNWDLVGNNTPIFFIRDPMLFPSFIHTQKRNPQTHLKDPDMFWDFITLRPETTHQVSFLMSDRGTPDGFRFMNGYGSHTFKMVNKEGKPVYCKFHFKTDQGIKNLMADQAAQLATDDPDYAIRDLYNAIAEGNFPSWSLSIQVMTFEEAERFRYNPFDLTKVWPQGEYPLIPVGRMVLNRNPKNYFAEVEQIAFSPVHMIPGIEASPDKMLQVAGSPNYFPNSFQGPQDNKSYLESEFSLSGDVKRYNTADEDNYSQVGVFWRNVLKPEERQRLVENIGNHLINASEFLQKRAVQNFSQADPDYGRGIQQVLDKLNAKRKSKQSGVVSSL